MPDGDFEAPGLLGSPRNHLPHQQHKDHNGGEPKDDSADQGERGNALLRRSWRRHAKVIRVHTIEEPEDETALAGLIGVGVCLLRIHAGYHDATRRQRIVEPVAVSRTGFRATEPDAVDLSCCKAKNKIAWGSDALSGFACLRTAGVGCPLRPTSLCIRRRIPEQTSVARQTSRAIP